MNIMKKNYLVIVVFVLLLSVSLAFVGGQSEVQAASGGEEALKTGGDLTIVGWPYAVDYVKELIRDFEEEYNIPAEFVSIPSGAKYNELLVVQFLAREPNDVIYIEDHNLGAYVNAGWIKPLNVCGPQDQIDKLKGMIQDSFNSVWTINGDLYGLPYYQAVWIPIYNKEIFTKAEISEFPSTWEDLKEACLEIKKRGIVEYPMTLTLAQTWANKLQLASMVFSIGGSMFNADYDPIFDKPDSAFRTAMDWLLDGLYVSKIINIKSLETNSDENWRVFAEGQSAVTMLQSYYAAQIFDKSLSKVTENASLAMMPGTTHEVMTWTRGFGVSAFTDAADKVWDLIDFLGGDGKDGSFYARKGWMAKLGLDSGYAHLWNDPDVREGMKNIGEENINITREQSKLSRSFLQPVPWMAAWIGDLEREISRALVKEITVDEAIKNLTSSWEKKKR